MEQEKKREQSAPSLSTTSAEHEVSKHDEPAAELDQLARQFAARIEGLRELMDVMAPHVAALDKPAALEKTIAKSSLSDRGKDVIRNLFVSPSSETEEADTPVVKLASADDKLPADAQPVRSEDIPPEIKEFSKVAQEEPGGVVQVMQRMTHGLIAPRTSLLHGSLLTVAVASFEFLVAGLFSFHLVAFPNQLKDDDQEFSLADLVELGSIEEARRILIERRADGFMRKSLGDWSKWSEKFLGGSFSDLTMDFNHVNEVFQRRHIIVHSGGAVSRLYLERVDHVENPPALGKELPVSAEYMWAALDELEVLGHGLLALARRKWDTEDPDRAASELNNTVYNLLRAKRWAEARKLAEVGRPLAQSDATKWMLAVNGWLAARGLEELGDCRKAILAWDVSALAHEFKLARACLLRETDLAFEELELTLKETDRSPRAVFLWPLLDELRMDPRFLEIFADFGYAPDNSVSESPSVNPDRDSRPDGQRQDNDDLEGDR